MSGDCEHRFVSHLKREFVEGRMGRREFLRSVTLLGLSAASAYAFVGKVTGGTSAMAETASLPKGGKLRIAMPVVDISNPRQNSITVGSNLSRQTLEYLTITHHDGVTRPHLLEGWEVSDDLKSWTLLLRQDVTWRSGRRFTADDVVWNIENALDPATGSSILGLMKSYMITEKEVTDASGESKTVSELWDANAVEKLDDHRVRLNCKEPQIAVPEHLFHYPFNMMDPAENGVFGPNANGTGAFELVEIEVGKRAVFQARKDYWGDGPYLDSLEFVDLGDDANATVAALQSKQVDGVYSIGPELLPVVDGMSHVDVYSTTTAQTGVARVKFTKEPWSDQRIRSALKLAVDPEKVNAVTMRESGTPAEHHHVSPVQPDYAELPAMKQDVERAKALLAEAGYPDGIDVTITCRKDPNWEPLVVQALVEQWRQAGIRAEINILPRPEYNKAWTEWELGFTGWSHRPLATMLLSLAYRSDGVWNESGYANEEFDKLLMEAEGTLDLGKRREIMAKVQKLMQDDGPIVQPVWINQHAAYDKKVRGADINPSTFIFGNELAVQAA